MTYLTFDEIIEDMVKGIGSEDAEILKNTPEDQLGRFHMFPGMGIRNHYLLWDRANPLTAQWFEDRDRGGEVHMVNGVDCHPQHPDAVCMEIIRGLHRRLNNPPDLVSMIDLNPKGD